MRLIGGERLIGPVPSGVIEDEKVITRGRLELRVRDDVEAGEVLHVLGCERRGVVAVVAELVLVRVEESDAGSDLGVGLVVAGDLEVAHVLDVEMRVREGEKLCFERGGKDQEGELLRGLHLLGVDAEDAGEENAEGQQSGDCVGGKMALQPRLDCDGEEDGDGDDGAQDITDFDGVRDEEGERDAEEWERGEREEEGEFGSGKRDGT